jgi:hypothetical protein
MIFPPLAFFIIIAVLQLFEEKTVVQFFAHVFNTIYITKNLSGGNAVLHKQKPVQQKGCYAAPHRSDHILVYLLCLIN